MENNNLNSVKDEKLRARKRKKKTSVERKLEINK